MRKFGREEGQNLEEEGRRVSGKRVDGVGEFGSEKGQNLEEEDKSGEEQRRVSGESGEGGGRMWGGRRKEWEKSG